MFSKNLTLVLLSQVLIFIFISNASCSEENYISGMEDAKVFSFVVELPSSEMRTRAEGGTARYGDGSTVNNLMCYVYNSKAESNALPIRTEAITIQDVDGKRGGSLAIDLPTAGVYDFVFIATSCPQDDKASKLWFDPSALTLNVNYDRMTANDEAADCFYYTLKNISMSSGSNHSVALKRPMAQLNLGTKDLTDYNTMSSSELKSVGVSVDGVYTSMNVMDGNVTGEPEEVTFSQSVLPSGQVYPASGATYLSMNYLLVNERKNVNVTMTAQNASSTFTTDIPDVPLQRNHQTNVYGNLLTKANDFKIEINPDFGASNKLDADDPYAEYDLVLSTVNKSYTCNIYFQNEKGSSTLDLRKYMDSNGLIKVKWEDVDMAHCNFLRFKDNTNLKELIKCNIDQFSLSSLNEFFQGCSGLIAAPALKSWDTSEIYDMTNMFHNCHALTTLDLSSFNTQNVTGMSDMFCGCKSLTSLDLSNFNTPNVTSMSEMFFDCGALATLDLSNFDTAKVKDMKYMFSNCSSLATLDLSSFVTTNVTDMRYMFYNCSSLASLDLSNFITPDVTNTRYMFCNCRSLASLDLSNFDTAKVTDMTYMFSNCNSLATLDLSSFVTPNVTNMTYMFYNCSLLSSLDLSSFVTTKVADMRYMFYNCRTLTSLDLSHFDTAKVTNMNHMFYSCRTLTSLDLSSFDTAKVTDMSSMFGICYHIRSIDLSSFDTSNVIDMNNMFVNCSSLVFLDLSSFNTANVTDMNHMFALCNSLVTHHLSSFDTAKVTNMSYMFSGCEAVKEFDLSNFDTAKVTDMNNMFSDCFALESLNLSSFNTATVLYMDRMFYRCYSLSLLDLSNFNIDNVKSKSEMFNGCPATVIW